MVTRLFGGVGQACSTSGAEGADDEITISHAEAEAHISREPTSVISSSHSPMQPLANLGATCSRAAGASSFDDPDSVSDMMDLEAWQADSDAVPPEMDMAPPEDVDMPGADQPVAAAPSLEIPEEAYRERVHQLWQGTCSTVMLEEGRLCLGDTRIHHSHHLTVHRGGSGSLVYCPRCMGMTQGNRVHLLAQPCRGYMTGKGLELRKRLWKGLWPTTAMQQKYGGSHAQHWPVLAFTCQSATGDTREEAIVRIAQLKQP